MRSLFFPPCTLPQKPLKAAATLGILRAALFFSAQRLLGLSLEDPTPPLDPPGIGVWTRSQNLAVKSGSFNTSNWSLSGKGNWTEPGGDVDDPGPHRGPAQRRRPCGRPSGVRSPGLLSGGGEAAFEEAAKPILPSVKDTGSPSSPFFPLFWGRVPLLH